MTGGPELWHAANRASWDESVPLHLKSDFYDVANLRAGTAQLYPIERAELGPLRDLDVLHLQCHFGYDSLILARQGARVTGVDFSAPAIAAARDLAAELGLADRARFIEANVYDVTMQLDAKAGFDLVFVTWGALMWLHDIRRWAGIVAHFIRPGGRIYLADGHPFALTLHEAATMDGDGRLRHGTPYFGSGPIRSDDPHDYADEAAVMVNSTSYVSLHTLGDIVTSLIDAGLRLEYLHEHDAVPWRMVEGLRADPDRMYRWPDRPWLPLAFSLSARRD